MITDIVKDKNNFCSVSYFDEFENSEANYTIKNEIIWKINSNRSKEYLVLNSVLPFSIKKIDIQFTGISKYGIFYTIDGINWYELPYKWYDGYFYNLMNVFVIYYLNDPDLSDIEVNRTYVSKYDIDTLVTRKDLHYLNVPHRNIGLTQEYIYDIVGKFKSFDNQYEIEIINEKDKLILENDNICETIRNNGKYCFNYYYNDENSVYIYNILVKQIKVSFFDIIASIDNPFELKSFSVIADEEISNEKIEISDRYDDFFNHRIFETETFMPSITKTFMNMLDSNENSNNVLNKNFCLRIKEIFRGIGYDPIGEVAIA